MNTVEKSIFEVINQEAKVILAELDELTPAKYDLHDPEQLAKNNEVFLEIFDRLIEVESIMKPIKE